MKNALLIYSALIIIILINKTNLWSHEYRDISQKFNVVKEIETQLINKSSKYNIILRAKAETTFAGLATGSTIVIAVKKGESKVYPSANWAPGSGKAIEATILYSSETAVEKTCAITLDAERRQQGDIKKTVAFQDHCEDLTIDIVAKPVEIEYFSSPRFGKGSVYVYYNYTITVTDKK